jgi:hypothetical protein
MWIGIRIRSLHVNYNFMDKKILEMLFEVAMNLRKKCYLSSTQYRMKAHDTASEAANNRP